MATLTLSIATRVARLAAINAQLGAAAMIRIYDGAIPDSPDAAPSGTLLSTMTGNNRGFGTVIIAGVNALILGAGGAGYNSAPIVAFTGGGGTGAAATAVISGGAIAQVSVTSPGSGYTAPPTVTLTGGGFTTAATPPMAQLGPVLEAAAITQDSAAAASGTAGWARLLSAAGAPVADVDCGSLDGDAALAITPADITIGVPVMCAYFLIDEA